MKIAITGSRGLIGSHLKTKLENNGHEIVEWDINVGKDIKDFSTYSLDYVVHLAAHANVRASFEDPNKYWVNNVENTKRIQEQCFYNHVPLIYASSSCVHNWWKSPYGVSKKVNEITAFSGQVGLRFTTVYGPGARDTMFITKLINGTLKYCTTHTRDFIHVDDVIEAITLLMGQDIRLLNPTYDVGTGNGVLVMDVAHAANFIDLPIIDGDECEAKDNTAYNGPLLELGWRPKHNVIDYVKKQLQI